MPVEADKPLGDQYFVRERIATFNFFIRNMADREGISLAGVHSMFLGSGDAVTGSTVDGVHLTADSYIWWNKAIKNAVTNKLCPG